MEDQIGPVLHWNHQKEPEQAKSKDEVIRRNLDRIHISAAAPLPSNPSPDTANLALFFFKKEEKKEPISKN